MKIVIDIPEDEYTWLKEHPNSIRWSSVYTDSILNGTPLPKGHGRLIDADDIDNHIIGHVDTRSCPTIIESDKENE